MLDGKKCNKNVIKGRELATVRKVKKENKKNIAKIIKKS